jgi:peptidoglycan/LPS O-acetylase OafA/YrhL
MDKKPLLNALTGIRFFAAIYVVLFHFAGSCKWISVAVDKIVQYGYIGVSIFFVLSGFVLAYNYHDMSFPSGRKRFWAARFARIYPLYIFAFIISIPGYLFYTKVDSLSSGMKFGTQVVLEAGLLQAWTPWTSCGVNYPGWSLSVEVFFYLLFPFILTRLIRLSNRRLLALGVVLWLGLLIAPATYQILLAFQKDSQTLALEAAVIDYVPLLHLPQFAIGMIAGLIYVRERRAGPSLNKVVAISAWIAFGVIALALFFVSIPYDFVNNGLFAPLFALIFFALAYETSLVAKLLSHPVFRLLGDSSYAIYLLQVPLADYFTWVTMGGPHQDSIPPRLLVFYTILLVAASIGSYCLMEKPARKWLVNKLLSMNVRFPFRRQNRELLTDHPA